MNHRGIQVAEAFGVTIEGHKTLIRGLRQCPDQTRRHRRVQAGGRHMLKPKKRMGLIFFPIYFQDRERGVFLVK